MISQLKRYISYSLLVIIVLFSNSCKDDKAEEKPTIVDRAVLIYMAADNNLSIDSYKNIQEIKEGALDNLYNGKLLVYQDSKNREPRLLEVYQENNVIKEKVKRTYPDQNSASGEVLSMVVKDAFSLYQTKSKGLMLWSHGTSWLPAQKSLWTRSFGLDGKDEMELSELKKALPDSGFDFIIFDACLMSSVEVVYELKDKADYIVASPNEIFSSGFPYKLIIEDLFSREATEKYLESICNTFYSFYANDADYANSASVSLIKTAGLDELSLLCNRLVKNGVRTVDLPNTQAMFHLKLTEKPILYDFSDFYSQLMTESEKIEMNTLLRDIIIWTRSTPRIYSSSLLRTFKVDRYSGLSSYIPQEDTPQLNAWYYNLDWGKTVYAK